MHIRSAECSSLSDQGSQRYRFVEKLSTRSRTWGLVSVSMWLFRVNIPMRRNRAKVLFVWTSDRPSASAMCCWVKGNAKTRICVPQAVVTLATVDRVGCSVVRNYDVVSEIPVYLITAGHASERAVDTGGRGQPRYQHIFHKQ